jgi:CysZ protein
MSRTSSSLRPRRLGLAGGLRAFAGGIGFILATPAVWGYALVPVALFMVLLCALGGLGIWAALHLGQSWLEPASLGGHLVLVLLDIVLALMATFLAVLLSLGLAQPLSGFALLAIVDAQTKALTGITLPRPQLSEALWHTFWVTLFSFAVCIPVFLGLFFLSLLFPPLTVITIPLKFLVFAWLLAWNFLDFPLSLLQMGVGARLHWIAWHFAAVTSFGVAWALFTIIPGIVFLFLPMGVAGATRLVLKSGLVVGELP